MGYNQTNQAFWNISDTMKETPTDSDAHQGQVCAQTQPNAKGLLMALELMELGIELVRQRFIRENPDASPEMVRKHVNEWLNSPRCAGLASRGPA
jgi:hypothetical protein